MKARGVGRLPVSRLTLKVQNWWVQTSLPATQSGEKSRQVCDTPPVCLDLWRNGNALGFEPRVLGSIPSESFHQEDRHASSGLNVSDEDDDREAKA